MNNTNAYLLHFKSKTAPWRFSRIFMIITFTRNRYSNVLWFIFGLKLMQYTNSTGLQSIFRIYYLNVHISEYYIRNQCSTRFSRLPILNCYVIFKIPSLCAHLLSSWWKKKPLQWKTFEQKSRDLSVIWLIIIRTIKRMEHKTFLGNFNEIYRFFFFFSCFRPTCCVQYADYFTGTVHTTWTPVKYNNGLKKSLYKIWVSQSWSI